MFVCLWVFFAKILALDIKGLIFVPDTFIPVIFVGISHLYHLILVLVVLTFVEGQKVSRKQNLSSSVSCSLFQLICVVEAI